MTKVIKITVLKFLGPLLIMVISNVSLFALGPDTVWTKIYGTNQHDWGNAGKQTIDKGYIITGVTNYGINERDIWLIKSDSLGNMEWTRVFSGAGNWPDEGFSVQQTTDSGYIVAGYSFSFNTSYDVWVIKTNRMGAKTWEIIYNDIYDSDEIAYSIVTTLDTNYVVTGETYGIVLLQKISKTGNIIWTKTYGDYNYISEGRDIQQTVDGGYIIAGATNALGNGGFDVYLIKINSFGDTLWTRTYGGPAWDFGYSVRQTPDTGYIVVGKTESFGNGGCDVYLIKTDRNGNLLWSKTFGGTSNDFGRAVRLTADGGMIIVGSTFSFSTEAPDVYVIKTDKNGDTLWTKVLNSGRWDSGNSIEQTTDGGYAITGETYYSLGGQAGSNVWFIKLNSLSIHSPNGGEIWDGGNNHNIRWYHENTALVSYYKLLYSLDGGNSYPYVIADSIENTDTLFVWFAPPINSFTVKVKVQAFNNVGEIIAEDMSNENFSIVTCPILVSPNGNEVWESGSTHTITWSVIGSGFASYRLLFSADGGNVYHDTIATEIPPDSSHWNWTLPLIHSFTCRVKIQILDSLHNTISEDVSDTNFSIIDIIPPTPFSLISPPDSAILSILRPTFTWQSSFDSISGFKYYKIYLNDSVKATLFDTTWTANYNLQEGYNNWYVIACDSANNMRRSNETWTFLIDTTNPDIVILISPDSGIYVTDSFVQFIWHKANDNLSGIDHYVLQYALDIGFSQGLVETTTVDTTFTAILSDTIYYWRVRAVDRANNSGPFSIPWQFEVDTHIPAAPDLILPQSGIYLSDTLVDFEWSAVTIIGKQSEQNHRQLKANGRVEPLSSPVRYILQVDTVIDFISPLIVDTFDVNSATIPLYENFPFYWRVKAYDLAGNQGPYSNSDSFGVDITAPVVESTTVWTDTSYIGPFEVRARVTDNLAGVDSVILFYQRDEDPNWISTVMSLTGPNWYGDTIPAVANQNDTVRYYIKAVDKAEPGNITFDPQGAPTNYYWFIANYTGIAEAQVKPRSFSFSLKGNPIKGKAVFNLALPEDADITLRIYDVSGRLIDKPIHGRKSAGVYAIPWTKAVSAGVYFYSLESPWLKKVGKFVLLR
ncbi:MAG: hypothetical protein ABIL70_09095 [candidate division WOR-3 bacterium]